MNPDLIRYNPDTSRIYLKPFDNQPAAKADFDSEGVFADRGIYTHNSVSAFFLNVLWFITFGCVNKVTTIHDNTGKVYHLNRESFNNWKWRQPEQITVTDESLTESILDAYCAARCIRDTEYFLESYDKDRSKELEAIDKLHRLTNHQNQALSQRITVYKQIQTGLSTHKELHIDGLSKDFDECSTALTGWDKAIDSLGSHAERSTTKEKQQLLKTVITAFKTAAASKKSPFNNSCKDIFGSLTADQLKTLKGDLGLNTDIPTSDEGLADEGLAKLKKQITANTPESTQIDILIQRQKDNALISLFWKIQQGQQRILTDALEADKKTMRSKVDKLIGEANGKLKQDKFDLEGGIKSLEAAREESPDEHVKTGLTQRITSLNSLVNWVKRHEELVKDDEDISRVKTSEMFDPSNKKLSESESKNKGQAFNEAYAQYLKISTLFNQFIPDQTPGNASIDKFRKGLTEHKALLKKFGIKAEELSSEELTKIESLMKSDAPLAQSLQKRYILSQITKQCKKLFEGFEGYLTAKKFEDQAVEALAKGNIEDAIKFYSKADHVSNLPQDIKCDYIGKGFQLKELSEFITKNIDEVGTLYTKKEHFDGKMKKLNAKINSSEISKFGSETQKNLKAILEGIESSIITLNFNFNPDLLKTCGIDMPKSEELDKIKEFKKLLPPDSKILNKLEKFYTVSILIKMAEQLEQKISDLQTQCEKIRDVWKKADEDMTEVNQALSKHDVSKACDLLNVAIKEYESYTLLVQRFEQILKPLSSLRSWQQELEKSDKATFDEMQTFCLLTDSEKRSKYKAMAAKYEEKKKLMHQYIGGMGGEKAGFSDMSHNISYGMFKEVRDFDVQTNPGTIPNRIMETHQKETARYKRSGYAVGRLQFKDIFSFDLEGWNNKIKEINSLNLSDFSRLWTIRENWIQAYNFVQLNRLMDSFFTEHATNVARLEPFFKFDAECGCPNFEYYIEKYFDKIKHSLSEAEKATLKNNLEGFDKAIFSEMKEYAGLTKSAAPSHASIEHAQAITKILADPKDGKILRKDFATNSQSDLGYRAENFSSLVEGLGVWNKLSVEQRNTAEGHKTKAKISEALLKVWADISFKSYHL